MRSVDLPKNIAKGHQRRSKEAATQHDRKSVWKFHGGRRIRSCMWP